MISVPQLTRFQLDFSGYRHLICVEREAIDVVYTKLKELENIPKNIETLQLGKIAIKENSLKIEQFDLIEKLQNKLIEILDHACMGTRFYAIGSEQFIGDLRSYARSFGMSEKEIFLSVFRSKSRRVYCSTCHTINYQVRTNIVTCSGCDIKLEIWNHFSRLKNAYLGVCIDAESPGKLPEIKEIFWFSRTLLVKLIRIFEI